MQTRRGIPQLACALSLVISVPASAAHDCTDLTEARCDDSFDNKAYFEDCLTAAESESDKTLTIPARTNTCYFSGTVDIPANVKIQGEPGAQLRGQLALGDHSWVDGVSFGPAARAIQLGTQTKSQAGTATVGAKVTNCAFRVATPLTAIIAWYCNDCLVSDNTINNSGTGQNIELEGGARNKIINNVIDGNSNTKTCILYRGAWHNVADRYGASAVNNVIMKNDCKDLDEECISFDGIYDSADGGMVREYDTVSSVNGNEITLSSGNWGGGDDTDYVGAFMIVIIEASGADAVGKPFRITGQNDAGFTLETDGHNIAAGDEIVIGAIYYQNYVAFNRCHGHHYGDAGVLLYGMCFNNRVEENSMRGLEQRSLDEIRIPTGSVTQNHPRALSGYNLFRANEAINDNCPEDWRGDGDTWDCCDEWVSNCDVDFIYHAFDQNEQAGHPGYSAYKTYGSVAIDNIVGDRVGAHRQDYFWGNPQSNAKEGGGPPTEFTSDSTDAGGTSLDTSPWTCEQYGLYCVDASETVARVADLDTTCSQGLVCSGYSAGGSVGGSGGSSGGGGGTTGGSGGGPIGTGGIGGSGTGGATAGSAGTMGSTELSEGGSSCACRAAHSGRAGGWPAALSILTSLLDLHVSQFR